MAFGFLFIQHATAQASGDADHAVEPVGLDELAPLSGDIEFILRGHNIARRAMHAILIQKQPDDLVPPASTASAKRKARREAGEWAGA